MNAEQQLFNLSYLEELEDKDFINEVIGLYIRDTGTDLEEMKIALVAGLMEPVCGIAHKLKSSTGMLQANMLFAVLEQIEAIAKTGEGSKDLAALIQTAGHEFDQLKKALELYLQSIEAFAW